LRSIDCFNIQRISSPNGSTSLSRLFHLRLVFRLCRSESRWHDERRLISFEKFTRLQIDDRDFSMLDRDICPTARANRTGLKYKPAEKLSAGEGRGRDRLIPAEIEGELPHRAITTPRPSPSPSPSPRSNFKRDPFPFMPRRFIYGTYVMSEYLKYRMSA